uniref:Uncharacterized protein n=1 Tax=Ulva partita TaxID=1605170 RepID=A0A1C9ZW73_9CHLO|nr:hypothetical protein [Ulva partita]
MVARLVDVALHSSLCSTLCPVREPAGNLFTLHMLRAPKASANFCTQSRQHYITYIPSSRKSCKWLSTPLKKSEARTANCKPAINVHAPACTHVQIRKRNKSGKKHQCDGLVFRNTATCRDLLQTGTSAEIALEWQNLPSSHTKQPTNTRKHSAHGQDRYFCRNGPCTTRTGSTTLLPCSIAASPNTSIRQLDHRQFK